MKLERYQLIADKDLMRYEFVSEGPRGKVIKIIEYTEFDYNIFNLGFGDKDITTGEMNDTVVTNNGDSKKVLATVANTIYMFTNIYPDVWIYAEGGTEARTRLYRMAITNNLAEVLKNFEVYGVKNNLWKEFEKKVDYEAFLIKRKF